MTTIVNFKNRMIALAIGLTMVSCSGSGQRPQSGNSSGSDGQTAKVETKAAAVAGSMDALTEDDMDEISQSWREEFTAKTGIKNIGKPKGSSVEMAMKTENGLFVINFECENSNAIYAGYAKSVWDLTQLAAHTTLCI